MNLLEKQKELHREGSRLLNETDFISILKQFGTLEVGGSYAYELLSYRDLDLGIISETLTKEKFGELVGALVSLPAVSKIKTSDRVDHGKPDDGRPHGYWIGVSYILDGEAWNIDIWYQKSEWQVDETAKWIERLSKLSDEQRMTILKLKEELRSQNRYGVGKEYQSVDVYKAVLENDMHSIEDLDASENWEQIADFSKEGGVPVSKILEEIEKLKQKKL